jgi:tetrahydromethanopterin S-methyltransferase subunit D
VSGARLATQQIAAMSKSTFLGTGTTPLNFSSSITGYGNATFD